MYLSSHSDHSHHLSGLSWEVPNLLSDSTFVPSGLFSGPEIGSKSARATTSLLCSHPLWLPSSSDQSQSPSLAPRIPVTSVTSPPLMPCHPSPTSPSHTGLLIDSQTQWAHSHLSLLTLWFLWPGVLFPGVHTHGSHL